MSKKIIIPGVLILSVVFALYSVRQIQEVHGAIARQICISDAVDTRATATAAAIDVYVDALKNLYQTRRATMIASGDKTISYAAIKAEIDAADVATAAEVATKKQALWLSKATEIYNKFKTDLEACSSLSPL